MPYSPTRRHKGCPICKSKIRGLGTAARNPIPVLRKLGRTRRPRRHEINAREWD